MVTMQQRYGFPGFEFFEASISMDSTFGCIQFVWQFSPTMEDMERENLYYHWENFLGVLVKEIQSSLNNPGIHVHIVRECGGCSGCSNDGWELANQIDVWGAIEKETFSTIVGVLPHALMKASEKLPT